MKGLFTQLFCVFIISLLCTLKTSSSVRCPPSHVLHPCTCIAYVNQISCWNINAGVDLRQVFVNLTQSLGAHKKQIVFDEFKIFDSLLTEIGSEEDDEKGDIFMGVGFHKISIQKNSRLSRIHKNAFSSSENYTTSVTISENPMLSNDSPLQREIFDLLNSFTNVREISLTDNNITSIPENAFRNPQQSLTWLSLIDNNIAHIGDHAFTSLSNLKYLILDGNRIENISERALELTPNPKMQNDTFRLYMRDNQLHDESFKPKSLSRVRRKLLLDLSRNNITHLPKKIFLPVFNRRGSAVIVRHNPLRCDCQFKWLYDSDLLYNASDPSKIFYVRGVRCDGHRDSRTSEYIDSDFKHCPDEEKQQEEVYVGDYDEERSGAEMNHHLNMSTFISLAIYLLLVLTVI